MTAGHCYIGTSGWSYAHWAKGRFYPKGLPQGRWLAFYARHFNTVEINATYYRLPRREIVRRWRQTPGPRFRFAVKLWGLITHRKRLVDCSDALRDYFDVIHELGPKRGPLLVQLPPSQGLDLERMERFLVDLKKVVGRRRWRVTVEFRHPTWRCDDAYELLGTYGVAVCLADMEDCPVTDPNDAAFVYVRRHGPGGRYRGCYGETHLADDAARIGVWLGDGRDVYVYFNNDVEGYAIDNAARLRQLLGDRDRSSWRPGVSELR